MAKTMFNQAVKEVKLIRLNYGAPKEFELRERVKTRDMNGKTITIDNLIVSNQIKKTKNEKGEYVTVMTKDGSKPIYQPLVYVGFDDTKYFVTKSQMLIRQLERLSNKTLVYYEEKDVKVDAVIGCKVLISGESVKYADGDYYEQIVFNDAE